MPHEPRVLLEDVRLAAQDIEQFTAGKSLADYQSDRLLRAGVERLYIIIGEALTRLERTDPALADGDHGPATHHRLSQRPGARLRSRGRRHRLADSANTFASLTARGREHSSENRQRLNGK